MSTVPALNILGNIRDKKFPSRSYYALEGDFNQPGIEPKDDGRKNEGKYVSSVQLKRTISDTSYTEASISDGGGDGDGAGKEYPYVCLSREPGAPGTASNVLSELKNDVTRLIDASIQKIEQTWSRETVDTRDVAEQATLDESPIEPETPAADVAGVESFLPPDDGDRQDEAGKSYREQNLLVLKSQPFRECTSRTRLKLLQEIQILVKRLKDMEKLE
ncbi:uncharacterized protein LOC118463605 isoform X2 [Anopheles albimanus]|uniref:uncharacterized protein LOC118463605 isoform X2 n=1 Tax=Anopheles albimanus TaxID=7167 RepID=UPI00163F1148|nr:uncharacterized protein LOC118463605 isoform X2 [Anopheles albimanus]